MICTSRYSVLLCKEIAFDIRDRSELMKYTCKELDVVISFPNLTNFLTSSSGADFTILLSNSEIMEKIFLVIWYFTNNKKV